MDMVSNGKVSVKPTDLLAPHIIINYYDSNSERIRQTHRFPSTAIPFQSFFGPEGQRYLHLHLSLLHYFTHDRIELLIPAIRFEVRQKYDVIHDHHITMTDSTTNVDVDVEVKPPRRFNVRIEFEVHPAEPEETNGRNGMRPASEEAMQDMLEKVKAKELESEKQCVICMEEFDDDDDDDVLPWAMPCGHVFHRGCIMRWLQTSHVCPICRYALPNTNCEESSDLWQDATADNEQFYIWQDYMGEDEFDALWAEDEFDSLWEDASLSQLEDS